MSGDDPRPPRGRAGEPPWLGWCRRLQAIAQNGLTYAETSFDVERYTAVRTVASEILAARGGGDAGAVFDLLAADRGYATPKVDVRAVVARDGRLLFVRERSDDRWSLPGGWADLEESPSENVAKEVAEESGFRVRADKLLAVYDGRRHGHRHSHPYHLYKLFFRCQILGGEERPGPETAAVGFFGADSLPALSTERVTAGQVKRMFAHLHHPDWPADFD